MTGMRFTKADGVVSFRFNAAISTMIEDKANA
jgi:hypothetical protein